MCPLTFDHSAHLTFQPQNTSVSYKVAVLAIALAILDRVCAHFVDKYYVFLQWQSSHQTVYDPVAKLCKF